MKTTISIFISAISTLAAPAIAAATTGWDGCYQMYRPNVMYPVFCLSGTTEEGIGGAGARLSIYGTNTTTLIACAVSSELRMPSNSLEYVLNGRNELVMKEQENATSGRREGEVTLGSTTLNYIQLNETESKHFEETARDPRCQNLAPGELLNLKK